MAVVAALAACPRAVAPTHEATVYFRGEPVAAVTDVVDGHHVVRRERFLSTGEVVTIDAQLDADGFAVEARYVRAGVRTVTVHDGALDDGNTSVPMPLQGRAVIIDLLRYVQPRDRVSVNLVDLSSGEAIVGVVERRGAEIVAVADGVVARTNVEGARTGPGAFSEGDAAAALDRAPLEPALASTLASSSLKGLRLMGIDDVLGRLDSHAPQHRRDGNAIFFDGGGDTRPPEPGDSKPSLFIESNDAEVVAFARSKAPYPPTNGSDALAAAAAVAQAVHALVDAEKKDEPPSARAMLKRGGDCDGAAALVVASLRALGHPARPVVGYRVVGGRLVPHAGAEAGTGATTGWIPVDATIPKVGADAAHVRLFRGLGGALTMGRVLGRLRVEPVP